MCVELLQDIGQWLGVGIANLAAALDPSCFVIGGGVSAADDLLIGPARDAFSSGLHTLAAIAAVVHAGMAILIVTQLRRIPPLDHD